MKPLLAALSNPKTSTDMAAICNILIHALAFIGLLAIGLGILAYKMTKNVDDDGL